MRVGVLYTQPTANSDPGVAAPGLEHKLPNIDTSDQTSTSTSAQPLGGGKKKKKKKRERERERERTEVKAEKEIKRKKKKEKEKAIVPRVFILLLSFFIIIKDSYWRRRWAR
mgnify:CR=1 FL=1